MKKITLYLIVFVFLVSTSFAYDLNQTILNDVPNCYSTINVSVSATQPIQDGEFGLLGCNETSHLFFLCPCPKVILIYNFTTYNDYKFIMTDGYFVISRSVNTGGSNSGGWIYLSNVVKVNTSEHQPVVNVTVPVNNVEFNYTAPVISQPEEAKPVVVAVPLNTSKLFEVPPEDDYTLYVIFVVMVLIIAVVIALGIYGLHHAPPAQDI